MQNLADEAIIVGSVLHAHAAKRGERKRTAADPLYQKRRAYKELMAMRAMDTLTATEGLEWIPTEFSGSALRHRHDLDEVAALFPMISMPTPTYSSRSRRPMILLSWSVNRSRTAFCSMLTRSRPSRREPET